jgi:digeranylgeranylglycerophospholipid reductase
VADQATAMSDNFDLTIVGAGFAGLACAHSAVARGLKVRVMERKPQPGYRIHTTGLLVKEVAEKLEVPLALTCKIHGVRLYAPNLRYVDLDAPGYYFLATDTPSLMAWLAARAQRAGAKVDFACPWRGAENLNDRLKLKHDGSMTRMLIGADGPSSAVAHDFGLGVNTEFLVGVETEYENVRGVDGDRLHCFLDSKLASGYIGWVIPGVAMTQVGLACARPAKPRLDDFMKKISALYDFSAARAVARRGGLIPVGGRVTPFAAGPVLLVGDAAGIVSPLTAGGIHTALDSGWRAAHAVADYLLDGGAHPAAAIDRHYPRFRLKRMLRRMLELNPPNSLYNFLLASAPFTATARMIYFHRRGVSSGSKG